MEKKKKNRHQNWKRKFLVIHFQFRKIFYDHYKICMISHKHDHVLKDRNWKNLWPFV